MKLRKILLMGIAAVMAVSAMSISAFAATDNEEVDFYNTVQVLEFNNETGSFDSSYEPASNIMPFTFENYTFHFDQNIYPSGTFLRNVDLNNDDTYTITDDDTLVLRLDQKPSQKIRMDLCLPSDNLPWGKGFNLTTSTTVVKLNGLKKYYSSYGSTKIKMTPATKTEHVSGSVSEF